MLGVWKGSSAIREDFPSHFETLGGYLACRGGIAERLLSYEDKMRHQLEKIDRSYCGSQWKVSWSCLNRVRRQSRGRLTVGVGLLLSVSIGGVGPVVVSTRGVRPAT